MKLNTGKKYKRQQPLTAEQQATIEQWHSSALRIARHLRRSFHDDHQLRTIAHDALIAAARYYNPTAGPTFQRFLCWIIRKKMFRSENQRLRTHADKLQFITLQFPDEFMPIAPLQHQADEDAEYLRHLRRGLTSAENHTITLIFDQGLTVRQAAAASGISPTAMRGRRDKALAKMQAAAAAGSR